MSQRNEPGDSKGDAKHEAKASPQHFQASTRHNLGGIFPFSQYQSRYAGCEAFRSDVLAIIDFSSFRTTPKICFLYHPKLTAIGSLYNKEKNLITVSNDSINIWDADSLIWHDDSTITRQSMPNKTPYYTFTFEALYDHPQEFRRMGKLHALPDSTCVLTHRGSSNVLTIDIAAKKSKIIKLTYSVNFSEFIEPHYLAMCHDKGISLYDVSKKDYLNKPPFAEFDIPRLENLLVWPGGHIWAIGQGNEIWTIGTGTEEQEHKKSESILFTFCNFKPGQPLKQTSQVPNVNNDPYLRHGPAFVIEEGQFCYHNSETLNSFNPHTGQTSILKNDQKLSVYSTNQGLCMQNYFGPDLDFIQLPPPIFLSVQKSKERLYEVITTYGQYSHGPASIIAGYVGLFFKDFSPPERIPRGNKDIKILEQLNVWIHEFKDNQTVRDELIKLAESILIKRDKTYSDCVNDCPALKVLAEKNTSFLASLVTSDAKLIKLAAFLKVIKNLDKPLGEFQLVRSQRK